VGPGYAETMGLRLRRGRYVDATSADDRAHAAVVTERFVEKQGWSDGLGETLRIDGQDVTVVGVIEDVLVNPVEHPPGILIRGAEEGYRFLTVRTTPGGLAGTRSALAATWAARAPDLPFEAFAQREVFDTQFESYGNLARGLGYLAGLALLIACMGVFGLATQNVARRLKEVSVRKVLGATVPHLVFLVNRAFVAILTVAALVATAVSYGAFAALASFDAANLMPLTPLPFVTAYVLVFLMVAVSVASQSRTLALAPPADALRSE
ncbi:MAG TPA: ABC transporter permease, partial [Rhodothermales bacterium]|nr:ABC transporter permease [Rhodothermales bacterium]